MRSNTQGTTSTSSRDQRTSLPEWLTPPLANTNSNRIKEKWRHRDRPRRLARGLCALGRPRRPLRRPGARVACCASRWRAVVRRYARWAEARAPARSAVSAKRSSITMNSCASSPSSSTARRDVASSRPCRLQSTPAGASISTTPASWSARPASRHARLSDAGERPPPGTPCLAVHERSAAPPSPGPDALSAAFSRWAERCSACCSPLDVVRDAGAAPCSLAEQSSWSFSAVSVPASVRERGQRPPFGGGTS